MEPPYEQAIDRTIEAPPAPLRSPAVRCLLLLALSGLCATLASCGGGPAASSAGSGGGGPDAVTLTLDWYPNADHAGVYVAQERGFFEDENLEVEIQQPSDPAAVLQLVAAGRSEFGISYENEVTNAAVREIPVQSVMAIMQEPLNSIIALEGSGIDGPEDLAGKRIGYAGQSFGTAVIDTVVEEAGADPASVEKINVGYDLRPALTSGRVDAIVDAYWNIEAVELEREGFETNVIRLPEVGVPNYNELLVATSDDYARENPEVVRRFVSALVRGHEAALEDSEAARDALLAANEELDPEVAARTLELTVPIFGSGGGPVGYQDPEEWEAYIAWAVENGVLEEKVDVGDAMTNEFLPEG
ncbi:pyrimidine biosynthesis enzyme [Rubrobacter marinus]|uniref:Thiamine pyrimidine synthase n=1 Tax=Rubrobacter marinus TaxID=2653852 RepID=A0A6G8PUQ0_9ACTN|nr:ABC transporter substrate-binding protein [Rubrobacter marinus]QIN77555.1 pyrimidine biosynthesis enzyme [Rubrobacter marinus]